MERWDTLKSLPVLPCRAYRIHLRRKHLVIGGTVPVIYIIGFEVLFCQLLQLLSVQITSCSRQQPRSVVVAKLKLTNDLDRVANAPTTRRILLTRMIR